MTDTSTDAAREAMGLARRGEQDQPKTQLEIKRDEMVGRIQRYEPVFIDLFSDPLAGKRFMQDAFNALRTTPELANCTPASVMGGFVWAAQCRLRIAGPYGHCWLIPFKDGKRGVSEATFVLGYKGVVTLGWRSGVQIMADTIYRNEKHRVVRGLHEVLEHEPMFNDDTRRGDPIIHYAIARSAAGLSAWRPISHDDALYVRDHHSKSYKANPARSPWGTDLIAMCQKTGVHRLAPYIPTDSDELVIPLQTDEAVQLIDNPDTPDRVTLTRMSEDDAADHGDSEPSPEREVIDVQPAASAAPPKSPWKAHDGAEMRAKAASEDAPKPDSAPRAKVRASAHRNELIRALRDAHGDEGAAAAIRYVARDPQLDPDYATNEEITAATTADKAEIAGWQQDLALANEPPTTSGDSPSPANEGP